MSASYLILPSVDGRETPNFLGPLFQRMRLALNKGPNGVDISLLSHEDRNRSNFRIVVFISSYLGIRIANKSIIPLIPRKTFLIRRYRIRIFHKHLYSDEVKGDYTNGECSMNNKKHSQMK
jgi:hypothetical protein